MWCLITLYSLLHYDFNLYLFFWYTNTNCLTNLVWQLFFSTLFLRIFLALIVFLSKALLAINWVFQRFTIFYLYLTVVFVTTSKGQKRLLSENKCGCWPYNKWYELYFDLIWACILVVNKSYNRYSFQSFKDLLARYLINMSLRVPLRFSTFTLI